MQIQMSKFSIFHKEKTAIISVSILLQAMEAMRREVKNLQDGERERHQAEITAIEARQKAVDDLERGVSTHPNFRPVFSQTTPDAIS